MAQWNFLRWNSTEKVVSFPAGIYEFNAPDITNLRLSRPMTIIAIHIHISIISSGNEMPPSFFINPPPVMNITKSKATNANIPIL